MEFSVSTLIDFVKIVGPTVAILVLIVIYLFRMVSKRDEQLVAMTTSINGHTQTLARLTTLIEVLVGCRRDK